MTCQGPRGGTRRSSRDTARVQRKVRSDAGLPGSRASTESDSLCCLKVCAHACAHAHTLACAQSIRDRRGRTGPRGSPWEWKWEDTNISLHTLLNLSECCVICMYHLFKQTQGQTRRSGFRFAVSLTGQTSWSAVSPPKPGVEFTVGLPKATGNRGGAHPPPVGADSGLAPGGALVEATPASSQRLHSSRPACPAWTQSRRRAVRRLHVPLPRHLLPAPAHSTPQVSPLLGERTPEADGTRGLVPGESRRQPGGHPRVPALWELPTGCSLPPRSQTRLTLVLGTRAS